MIISASYRTDIPTFYGEWFVNRLRAGYCRVINPYNQQPYRVSLLPEDVDGFVFWTKNLVPFLTHLPEVAKTGRPFMVQYTINGYPRALESAVVDADRSVKALREVAEKYGPAACVWRYDTILYSSLTPAEFHLHNFERLAQQLEGATDEVVISFAHFYTKTLRNINTAANEHEFTWQDPPIEEKKNLASQLVALASAYGMRLSICSQRNFLVEGTVEARCVDADRFQRISGRKLTAKLKGNREECGCFESRDIGDYDTCPHGCVYCYAVRDRGLALKRYQEHDPASEFLYPPPAGTPSDPPKRTMRQLSLFTDDDLEAS